MSDRFQSKVMYGVILLSCKYKLLKQKLENVATANALQLEATRRHASHSPP